jgi:type IV secretory pathway component VirB8
MIAMIATMISSVVIAFMGQDLLDESRFLNPAAFQATGFRIQDSGFMRALP